MKTPLALCLAAAAAILAGCASFDGRGLVPGQSSAADVERIMGAPAETRQAANGETWLYYPRQPYGRRMFVARLGADGRLVALEQRLTDENVEKLRQKGTTAEQARMLLGPPTQVAQFDRLQREVWTYRTEGVPYPRVLHVQISPDGVVREVYHMDDPEVLPRNDGASEPF